MRFGALSLLALVLVACDPNSASSQERRREPTGDLSEPGAVPLRQVGFPTDRTLKLDAGLPVPSLITADPGTRNPELAHAQEPLALDIKQMSKPIFSASFDWEPRTNAVGLSSFDVSVQQPIYPVFGPPPPVLNSSYSLTSINAARHAQLPATLHEFALGAAWMRRINDSWMARMMLSGAFASDLENTTGSAWQIRGGVFGLYRHSDHWNFAVGAIATGRDDLPVLPAVGAIWEPSRRWKINLMMPQPRVSRLLSESSTRQHWGYVGAGISGGTWAYQQTPTDSGRLTYREWRLVLGWESIRPQPPGTYRPSGNRWTAEIGYAIGRRFEFDSDRSDLRLSDSLLLSSGFSF